MSAELVGIVGVGIALAGFLWKIRQDLDKKIDDLEQHLEAQLKSMDEKVENLTASHHALAREVSEFRGEMRGRIQRREQSPPFTLEEAAGP